MFDISNMALSINNTVLAIMSVAVGIILIGSLLAPIVQSTVDDLTATVNGVPVYDNGASWASLISVVVVICILGLIIIAINQYTGGKAK